MPLSTSKQLYEAILLLREEEARAQKELAKRIKKRGAKKEKQEELEEKDEEESLFGDDEEPSGDEETGGDESGDEEGGEEDEPQDDPPKEEKDKGLAGADELNDTPQELPHTLKGNDFVDKINKIRAGASLKDKDVQTRIIGYVKSLTSDERDDLWINLDSLARIVLGGVDPAQVLTPSLITGPNKGKKERKQSTGEKTQTKKQKSEPKYSDAPIVAPVKPVSEGFRKQMTEVPFVLRSNRTVPFGHSSHVRDLERLLSDLMRFRSCQERGSESWMSIGLAIKTIKSQLSHARRKSMGVKNTIDTVDVESAPKLVEED